jgi:hypothetical protein
MHRHLFLAVAFAALPGCSEDKSGAIYSAFEQSLKTASVELRLDRPDEASLKAIQDKASKDMAAHYARFGELCPEGWSASYSLMPGVIRIFAKCGGDERKGDWAP